MEENLYTTAELGRVTNPWNDGPWDPKPFTGTVYDTRQESKTWVEWRNGLKGKCTTESKMLVYEDWGLSGKYSLSVLWESDNGMYSEFKYL